MSEIDNTIRVNLKRSIKGHNNFWGLPYSISNTGCDKVQDKDITSDWRRDMYLGMLGYISVDMMKDFNKKFSVNKPLSVLRKISNILMDLSYSIWTALHTAC